MHHLEIGQRAEPKWNRNGSSGQESQLERKGRFSYTILINSVLGLNYLLPNVVVDMCFPMFSIFWCRTVDWGKASNTAKLLAHFGVRCRKRKPVTLTMFAQRTNVLSLLSPMVWRVADPDFADLLCSGMPTHIPRKQQDELNMLKLSNVWKTIYRSIMEAVKACQLILTEAEMLCWGVEEHDERRSSVLFRVNSNQKNQRIDKNCRESFCKDFALAISQIFPDFPGSRKSSKMTLKVPWYSSRARFLDISLFVRQRISA